MQNRILRTFYFLILILISFNLYCQNLPTDSIFNKEVLPRLNFLASEYRIDSLMEVLSKKHRPGTHLIKNVNIVSINNNKIEKDMSLLIRKGKIEKIGKTSSLLSLSEVSVIDGKGKYLFPGLTDMHYHLSISSSHRLLLLLNGITTIRNMAGLPWILEVREKVNNNEILAPNIYTTGPILSYQYFGMGEARVNIKTADQAIAAIRKQKEAGYDFIKVHDGMNLEIFKAVIDEANKVKLKVVGHIPEGVKPQDAIELGQFTLEHLTGYIGLIRNNINAKALNNTFKQKPWVCPTSTLKLGFASKENKLKYLKANDNSKYFNPYWIRLEKGNPESSLQRMFLKKISKQYDKAFNKLFLQHQYKNIISGTDAGHYTILLPGVSLYEELIRMEELGITTLDVLKSTTVNAAKALEDETLIGTIAEGKRADFILLSKNPLLSAKNLDALEGVMVRGIWLSGEMIKATKQKIAAIYKQKNYENSPKVLSLINSLHQKYKEHPGVDLKENFAVGVLLNHYGKVDEAITVFEKLIAKNTIIWDVYDVLGALYEKKKNKALALKHYRKSLHLNPSNKSTKDKIKSLE